MEDEIKYCKRCGRKLRSKESKERGYGKICFLKIQSNLIPLFTMEGEDNELLGNNKEIT